MSTACCVCFNYGRITARFTCGHFSWCQTCEIHLRAVDSLLCTVCGVHKNILRFTVQNISANGPSGLDNQIAQYVLQPSVVPNNLVAHPSNQNCNFCWTPNRNTVGTSCMHMGWCERCAIQMQHETSYRCPYCQRDREIVTYSRPRPLTNQINPPPILTVQHAAVAPSNHVADASRRISSDSRLQQVRSAVLVRDSAVRYRLPNASIQPLNEISLPVANALPSHVRASAQRDVLGILDFRTGTNSQQVQQSLRQAVNPIQNQVHLGNNTCCICFRSERNVITSCGHVGWCVRCVQQWVTGRRQLCPVCDGERDLILSPSSSNLNPFIDSVQNSTKKRKISEIVEQPQNKVEVEISEDMAQTCCVCLENERDTAFNPCGHRCVCSHCAREVFVKKRVCPLCQSSAISILRIYL